MQFLCQQQQHQQYGMHERQGHPYSQVHSVHNVELGSS
jgi:hypothetical protein